MPCRKRWLQLFCALVSSPWWWASWPEHISSQPLFRKHTAGRKFNIEGAHWLGQTVIPALKIQNLTIAFKGVWKWRNTCCDKNQMCPYRMPPWEGQCGPLGYTVELMGIPSPHPSAYKVLPSDFPHVCLLCLSWLVRNTNQHAFPEHLRACSCVWQWGKYEKVFEALPLKKLGWKRCYEKRG